MPPNLSGARGPGQGLRAPQWELTRPLAPTTSSRHEPAPHMVPGGAARRLRGKAGARRSPGRAGRGGSGGRTGRARAGGLSRGEGRPGAAGRAGRTRGARAPGAPRGQRPAGFPGTARSRRRGRRIPELGGRDRGVRAGPGDLRHRLRGLRYQLPHRHRVQHLEHPAYDGSTQSPDIGIRADEAWDFIEWVDSALAKPIARDEGVHLKALPQRGYPHPAYRPFPPGWAR